MATKRKPPIVALGWAGSELVVVSGRAKDFEYVVLREGKVTSRGAAVKGTVRVVALPSGEVMTVSREGVTRVGGDLLDTGFAVHDVIACHGEVWAGGEGFARYDATARAWVRFPLDVQVDDDGGVGFAAGAKGPIVAVRQGKTCQLRNSTGGRGCRWARLRAPCWREPPTGRCTRTKAACFAGAQKRRRGNESGPWTS